MGVEPVAQAVGDAVAGRDLLDVGDARFEAHGRAQVHTSRHGRIRVDPVHGDAAAHEVVAAGGMGDERGRVGGVHQIGKHASALQRRTDALEALELACGELVVGLVGDCEVRPQGSQSELGPTVDGVS